MELENVKMNVQEESGLEDITVKIFRSAKVVKGGRRFSFEALVVVGDRAGTVGLGYAKANEVPQAVDKAVKEAKKDLHKVVLCGKTLPHQITVKYGATKVTLVPAGAGTGVIAGASARAVLELAGIQDVLTKVYGSTNAKNVVKATIKALQSLRSKDSIESVRGVPIAVVSKV